MTFKFRKRQIDNNILVQFIFISPYFEEYESDLKDDIVSDICRNGLVIRHSLAHSPSLAFREEYNYRLNITFAEICSNMALEAMNERGFPPLNLDHRLFKLLLSKLIYTSTALAVYSPYPIIIEPTNIIDMKEFLCDDIFSM